MLTLAQIKASSRLRRVAGTCKNGLSFQMRPTSTSCDMLKCALIYTKMFCHSTIQFSLFSATNYIFSLPFCQFNIARRFSKLSDHTRRMSSFLCTILIVFLASAHKKMFWITTGGIVTMMTNAKSFWYRSVFQRPCNSMGKNNLSAVQNSIPSNLSCFKSSPRPARIWTIRLICALPESILKCSFVAGYSKPNHFLVMCCGSPI